jgi:hypothetical protein
MAEVLIDTNILVYAHQRPALAAWAHTMPRCRQRIRASWTPAEYLAIERKAETRSEYIDGRAFGEGRVKPTSPTCA